MIAGNGRKKPAYDYLQAMYALDEIIGMLRRDSRLLERLLADEDTLADLSDWDRFGASFPEDLEEHADALRALLRRLGAWSSPGGEWGGAEETHEPRSERVVPAGPRPTLSPDLVLPAR